ncbi:porin [Halospina sp. K52047b]|nr:porin [Halospina sp. K52047b]
MMTMKKKILALAVSGGLAAAPMGAMAAPELYGIVDIGVESFNDSDGVAANELFGGLNSVDGTNSTDGFTSASRSDAKDFELSNGLQSRIGIRGSEELPVAGLTASYNMEFAIDVLDEDGGGIGNAVGTRLGWAALGGDWGKVKIGSQWQALYEFGGWNTHRTDVHGYGSYYYTTSALSNSLSYGFRQSSAISYEYGSAWGHSDPFAAQITLGVGEGSDSVGGEYIGTNTDGETVQLNNSQDVANEEGISSIQAAFQYSFDQRISVNAVYVKEFNDYDSGAYQEAVVNNANNTDLYTAADARSDARSANQEPQLINVGARWSVTDALELTANYTQVDLDNASDDKRDSIAVASFMDFGEGLTGHLGFAQASDDGDKADLDLDVYGYVKQALSDRTDVRLELEHVKYDNAQDSSATVALVALQHNF